MSRIAALQISGQDRIHQAILLVTSFWHFWIIRARETIPGFLIDIVAAKSLIPVLRVLAGIVLDFSSVAFQLLGGHLVLLDLVSLGRDLKFIDWWHISTCYECLYDVKSYKVKEGEYV